MNIFLVPPSETALPGNGAIPGEKEHSIYEKLPVAESEPVAKADINTASFVFQKDKDEGRGQGGGSVNHRGAYTPQGNTFPALIELAGKPENVTDTRENLAHDSAMAVGVYEKNIRIIGGTDNALGSSVNLSL